MNLILSGLFLMSSLYAEATKLEIFSSCETQNGSIVIIKYHSKSHDNDFSFHVQIDGSKNLIGLTRKDSGDTLNFKNPPADFFISINNVTGLGAIKSDEKLEVIHCATKNFTKSSFR